MTRKNRADTGRDEKGRFGPGNAGKPKGARHRTTQAVEALLEGEAEQLTRRAIVLALGGDITALRLYLDWIAPPRRDNHVSFKLPQMQSAGDARAAAAAILQAVSDGDLSPG